MGRGVEYLGLVEAVDRLSERIVIRVADAADGRFDAGIDEPLGVAQREVLRTSVTMMHETAALERTSLMQGLLQGVEHEAGMGGSGNAPADDATGEDVDYEGHVYEAGPGRHVGEVRHPQGVRMWRLELPIDAVERAGRRGIGYRGANLSAPHDAPQPHDAHQPRHRAAGDVDALAAELPPHLAHAVDTEVRLEHAADLNHQYGIALGPWRQLGGIDLSGGVDVIGRRGDRQHPADRLDPVNLPMIVDEGDHGRDRRSSPAMAKYALALRRISYKTLGITFAHWPDCLDQRAR